MEKNPTMIVVAAAFIDADGRVLLQQRPQGRHMAGLWEFPGGKVELDERPEAALVRELEEELGVQVEEVSLTPSAFASAPLGEKHLILLLYLCREWRGEIRAIEASGLKWLTPGQMDASEMPPADRPLIGLLEALI